METNFEEYKRIYNFTSLDEDLILIDDVKQIPQNDAPVLHESTAVIIVRAGSIDIGIDLNRYTITAPSILVILSEQIVQYFGASSDHEVLVISFSKKFNNFLEVDIKKGLPLFLKIKECPHVQIKAEDLKVFIEHYNILKAIISQQDNHYQYEAAKYLTYVSFYMMLNVFSKNSQESNIKQTTQENLFESFYLCIQQHYKQERELKFYANKLCITPKYLSFVIKQTSGKSAKEWIDSCIIIEAKALLKSSKMTIQQISNELNFPSQSFFAKYFKRRVGVSPKEYKNQ